ncbi:u14-Nephitoxin-Nsp1b_1 [Nephila pilipes]|uniref:U14-Nephitoxin-Nsp1b_1 n=1 Tax=Nephila pilipes TaxID=299642 RepID=A0A8X6QSE1_NEPPI|nr:u14-Nephitoxin-Nsp1b_1 [Nephila pilipes]
MKLIFLTFAVVFLVAEAHGFFDGSNGNRGMMRPPFGRHPPPSFFPACSDFMKEVHEKMEENRRRPCTKTDRSVCRWNDLMDARMAVTQEPSNDCLTQVEAFYKGIVATTTTKVETEA